MGMPLLQSRIPGAVLPEDPSSNKEDKAGEEGTVERVLIVADASVPPFTSQFLCRLMYLSSDIEPAEIDLIYSTENCSFL
jgi:hypothetical protein